MIPGFPRCARPPWANYLSVLQTSKMKRTYFNEEQNQWAERLEHKPVIASESPSVCIASPSKLMT